jgi:predicted DNA binding CopG/RHH family protein
MKEYSKKAFEPLDKEEKEIMESLENGEWKPVKNFEEEKSKAVLAARNTLKRDKKIKLHLSQKDYHQIQVKALEEGIPVLKALENKTARSS